MRLQTKEQKEVEKKIRRHYLKERMQGGGFDSWLDFECKILERCIKDTIGKDVFKGKNALELGSENGHLGIYFLNRFNPETMVVSDLSDSLISAVPFLGSCMNYKTLPKICIIDNIALPFKNESFDMVFSCNAIHHIPDLSMVIEEVERVLKKNGIFFMIHEPFLPAYLFFLKFMFSRAEKKQGLCENIFSLKEWINSISNFEILHIEFYPPHRLKSILPNTTNLFKYITGGWFTLLARRN